MPPKKLSPLSSVAILEPELIALLQEMVPAGSVITPQTRILSDLDLDSLKMIELIDILKAHYGVDFLEPPHSVVSLQTVESLAAALNEAARSR